MPFFTWESCACSSSSSGEAEKMTVVEEQTSLHTEVQAETSLSTIRTAAVPDTSLLQSFLELPVPVVLLTLWLVGAALIGLCALMLYDLLWMVAGA